MAASLQDIYNAINSLTQSLNHMTTVQQTFPHTTASSSAPPATTGTISFTSSEAAGFLLFQSSSGATVKIPFYSNP